jgi:tRNA A-37 threonylcarbamoyl transferase component Bud32
MSKYPALSSGGWRWRVAEDRRADFASGPFARFDDLIRAGKTVKDLRIKRTVEVRAEGREYLVKLYKGRGALQGLRSALLGSRASRELRALLGALGRGVPTLPFVAVGERKSESCVIVEKLADRVRLDILLASSPRRRALIGEYGRWARRVHDSGVSQYDFNPTNVLARPGGDPDLRLIDFEKVTVGRPPAEAARLRSLAKIDRMIPASRADRLRFLKAYFGREAEDRAGLRARIERVTRFGREQVAKDARRRRDGCVRESRNFARFRMHRAWGWYRRGAVDDSAIAEVADGTGRWRRVPAARAIDAWRAANGSIGEEPPVAVVVERGGSRGHLVYPPGLP